MQIARGEEARAVARKEHDNVFRECAARVVCPYLGGGFKLILRSSDRKVLHPVIGLIRCLYVCCA